MTTGNWLNLVGLVYDITGAVLLGLAVVFNSKKKMAQQVMTAWNYNKHLIPAVVEQRIDGVAGLFLLVLGFCIQGVSDFYAGTYSLFIGGLVLLAIMAAIYIFARAKLVQWQTASVIQFIEEWQRTSSERRAAT
jgi:hypothetical protein